MSLKFNKETEWHIAYPCLPFSSVEKVDRVATFKQMNVASPTTISNHLNGFNHHHLVEELPLYKDMPPFFDVYASSAT
jgi:hypothetical protein